ncbi:MAG: hypothetical protein ABIJ16_09640 [Bacteroidota bacterium]
MKVFFFFILHLSVFSQEITIDGAEERNGITYLKGDDVPFTGKTVAFGRNGNKQSEGNCNKGAKTGLWIEWDEEKNETGRKTY